MIIDSYSDKPGKMSPKDLYGPGKKIADVCIIIFSYNLMIKIRDAFPLKEVARMNPSSGSVPIYLLKYKGKKVCIYNSMMGSALAGTCIIEASHFTGVKKFIMFGTCGRLDKSIGPCDYVIPTEAYRDEGFSYHYAPASDYIAMRNHIFVENFFQKNNLSYVNGKTWTTDAFYKETELSIAKRRMEGCLTVEMECAGCQAVVDYYGFDLYNFLFGGDLLDAPTWDKSILGSKTSKKHYFNVFNIALELSLIV